MRNPVVGGKAFDRATAARKYWILLDALKRAKADVWHLTFMARDGRLAGLESARSKGDDVFARLERWQPHNTERLQEELEQLRDAVDYALKVFADRTGTDRERELIRHLREANYPGPEGENAKRLADVRERKLEAGDRTNHR
jgi:hypothetical protein